MTWTIARAPATAESCLGDMGDRWLHVLSKQLADQQGSFRSVAMTSQSR